MFNTKTKRIHALEAELKKVRAENHELHNARIATVLLLRRWEMRHVPAWITKALREAMRS